MSEHGVGKHDGDPDNFSLWHRCKRWTERGLTCPFGRLEKEGEESEEDADARPSGAAALQRAVGDQLGVTGFAGALDFIGPLLALFTIMRAIETLGPGLKMGRVAVAGAAEEATVRTLRPLKEPKVPAKEGPRPSRPTPAKAPVVGGIRSSRGFAGGGFFSQQSITLKGLIGKRP